MEHCSTHVSPNYNNEQRLEIAGVNRPPKTKHPSYEEALMHILRKNKAQQITTFVARNLHVNTWRVEFQQWIDENELSELTDPAKPTLEAGRVDYSIPTAAGRYIPEGVLPEEEGNMKGQYMLERFPAYVTENRGRGEHIALSLDFGAIRPDAVNDEINYNIRSLTDREQGQMEA